MPNYNNYPYTQQMQQPYYQQVMQQPYQQMQPMQQYQQMQAQNVQQQMVTKQNEFVRVRSKEEAKNYPVAPSNSVTFINETAPYCYVKTMGASQLDRPVFETYRLVKEDEEGKTIDEEEKQLKNDYSELKTAIAKLQKDMDDLKSSVKTLKDKKPVKKVILQEADDE